jgi:hypothetical protein
VSALEIVIFLNHEDPLPDELTETIILTAHNIVLGAVMTPEKE